MNLLVYAAVGCAEWWLSLRRTWACAHGQTFQLVSITFIENLLGLWVLSTFIRANDWWLAVAYSTGGALGAYLVAIQTRMPKSQ